MVLSFCRKFRILKQTRFIMKNILVPLGNSPDSHDTLQYAVHFAAQFGATVYVMEVLNVTSRAGDLANIRE